jgi:hypothetical protein
LNTTIKGLTPGATYNAFAYASVRPWADMRQTCPLTPLASGAADANGSLTLDLPERREIGLQGADTSLIQINNAQTVVTSL